MDFDGIELSDLENSGSSFEPGETPEMGTEAGTNEETEIESVEDTQPQTESGIDEDFLAGLESSEEIETGSNEEENKDTKAPSDDGKATSSSQNKFTSLASALNEEGAFNITEEELAEITDASSLLEKVLSKVEESTFNDLNENQQEYLTALRAGVPHETYTEHKGNADQYSKLADDDIKNRPALAQELIKRNFLIQGMDLDTANKYSALAMKDESSTDDAIKAKNALVAYENSKIQDEINAREQEKKDAQSNAEKALAELKSKITESSEVIPGIKINSITKEKVFSSMTTPVKQDEDGNPLNAVMDKYSNDPEYKMKLHTLHEITKGFTDFSKFTKTFKSEAARKLEKQIETNNIKTGSSMKSTGVVSASQLQMKDAIDKLDLGKL